MNQWRTCTLGDLLEVRHGFAFLGEYFASQGTHVVLTPGNFSEGGGFRAKGDKEKWYTGPIPSEYVLSRGDVLVAMTEQAEGLLGSSAKVPSNDLYLHNQRLGLISVREGVDLDFAYHLFNTPLVRQQIRASASGTKVRHTAPKRIAAVKVLVPPLPVQRRVAGILSSYDDLIDNCERRIRLLDEMARALYREWFVWFRYPGHEKVPLVESALGKIPKGWDVLPVADVFETLGGGTPSRKNSVYWIDGTTQWFAPSDITGAKTMFMDDSSERITERGLAESSAKLFMPGAVMLTSRATIGAIAINTQPACTNQGFITCIPSARMPVHLLFHWVRESVPLFERLATGATFKEISRGVFRGIELAVPPSDLSAQFEDAARATSEAILNLQRRARLLRSTRDLLLPRLLSGQLPVEEAA